MSALIWEVGITIVVSRINKQSAHFAKKQNVNEWGFAVFPI
jgi:hypothetical protein